MTEEQQMALIIRGSISKQEPEWQAAAQKLVQGINELRAELGNDEVFTTIIALYGAEISAAPGDEMPEVTL